MNNLLLILIGAAGGLMTAGGIFALITVVGIIPRLASKTRTAEHMKHYETAILLGGTVGNLLNIYGDHLCIKDIALSLNIPLIGRCLQGFGNLFLYLFALCSGIYIGCLVMALAETLQVMPILIRRIRLTKGLQYMILCYAIGKCVGSLWYFLRF